MLSQTPVFLTKGFLTIWGGGVRCYRISRKCSAWASVSPFSFIICHVMNIIIIIIILVIMFRLLLIVILLNIIVATIHNTRFILRILIIRRRLRLVLDNIVMI